MRSRRFRDWIRARRTAEVGVSRRRWSLATALEMRRRASPESALDLADGWRLVAARGRRMQALPRTGAMAAVWASEPRVLEAVRKAGGRLSIAAVNGPASIVVSGSTTDCSELCAAFERDGVRTQRLNVSNAFHSARGADWTNSAGCGRDHFCHRRSTVSNAPAGCLGAAKSPTLITGAAVRDAVRFVGHQTLASAGARSPEVGPHPFC